MRALWGRISLFSVAPCPNICWFSFFLGKIFSFINSDNIGYGRQKKKKKVTFTPQFLGSCFFLFNSLNFLMLCQLLGKREGKEEKNSECGNGEQAVLALLRPESAVGS